MQGTITSGSAPAVNRNPWRTDKPPVGEMVEVWLSVVVVLAKWTGQHWETVNGGTFMDGLVTHWRERV